VADAVEAFREDMDEETADELSDEADHDPILEFHDRRISLPAPGAVLRLRASILICGAKYPNFIGAAKILRWFRSCRMPNAYLSVHRQMTEPRID
jgi:hypothetical protein